MRSFSLYRALGQAFFLAAYCSFFVSAISAKPKAPATRRTSAATTHHTTSTAAQRGRSKKAAPTRTASAWRSRQAQPTPERYMQIQQALATKGYLKSTPSGAWDPESQDAMRRFQVDQKLDVTGNLNSRSLIGLGLGPGTSSPASVEPKSPEK